MLLAPRADGSVIVDHVSRSFRSKVVLGDLSLHLTPGSITEIAGDNGAGKTSLLRLIAGTLAPDTGTITVCGETVGRGNAAIVAAGDRALYWRLTGRQELEFYARLPGTSRSEAQQLAAAASSELQLDDLIDTRIGVLSTGQRRRLMMARSLVGCAPVLLLDEPFADLDDAACSLVDTTAHSWAERGGLVLWTSPTAGAGPTPTSSLRLEDGRLADA